MDKRPTIRDVAKLASVSVTAVSQILNGKGERFSQETRTKVVQARDQLGYQADYYARGLVGQRGNSLGIVIPDIMNPFFASLVVAVQSAAIPQGYYPEVFSVNGFSENIDHFIDQFGAGSQKGLILAAPGASHQIVEALAVHEKLPMVFTDQAEALGRGDTVGIDEVAAGNMIATHLLEQGHRRIAIVLPPHLTGNLVKRFTGYQEAFSNHSVLLDPELVFHCEFSPAGGLMAAEKIVDTDATAVIAVNDDVAMGVYRGLLANNKRIPEDYSVVGFDDISMAQFLTPSLTTIAQPVEAIGEEIVNLMLQRMREPERPYQEIQLPVRMVFRESTTKTK
ncbi:LacI family DNA-binding transcriptional regulator [Lacticaseibacillus sp. N501-2]|uniref:LacI family DNA-binding transcriptional regulator n=1 Tax=Lacticaseibacillus salsurae TaxID=3367729 RepID=UPI0038B2FB79